MSALCARLHEIVRNGSIFSFGDDLKAIPKNGIYIMFEKNEFAHGGNRIVRIGTHTGEGQLPSRIFQHFENENKNRSIFRKNIGRCILNREQSDYLPVWDLDTTSRKGKERSIALVDEKFETAIEKRITRYVQENLTFSILEIPSKNNRLFLEARLIGTVSGCDECSPSKSWLGNFSTKEKIRKSGLWQVNELHSPPISEKDLESLANLLIR